MQEAMEKKEAGKEEAGEAVRYHTTSQTRVCTVNTL